jgi:DNA invertase Pin-like site-specific DNA recombinase
MKHVAIYCRVSTKQQDQRSQEPDLKRWAASQDEPVVWYRDSFTGRSMERPDFTRLLAHAASGQVSKIVVWRLDRLGRTARGLTALFEELATWRVDLVSLRDGLDLSTPAGRLMANVLASVAAYETEVRAERVLAGQSAARAAGKRWGGSKPGRRLKTRATREQATTASRLHQEGEKIAAIARAVGLSRPTVYALLGNGRP